MSICCGTLQERLCSGGKERGREKRRGSVDHRQWVILIYRKQNNSSHDSAAVLYLSVLWSNARFKCMCCVSYIIGMEMLAELTWLKCLMSNADHGRKAEKVQRTCVLCPAMPFCATPAAMVITRWRQCQPLVQPAAALAISQIKVGHNLPWSVRGNRWWWWRRKQLESEIALLIRRAITKKKKKSHHRKLRKKKKNAANTF